MGVLSLSGADGVRISVQESGDAGGVVAYLVAIARPGRISRLIIEDAPPPYPRSRALPERPAGELPFDWAVGLHAGHNIHAAEPEQFIGAVRQWLGGQAL